jgi:hypothetical protein
LQLALAMTAKCHLLMGNWPLALQSAQQELILRIPFLGRKLLCQI